MIRLEQQTEEVSGRSFASRWPRSRAGRRPKTWGENSPLSSPSLQSRGTTWPPVPSRSAWESSPGAKKPRPSPLGPLTAAGYAKSFVVRESIPRGGGEARLAIRGPENFFRVNRTGYLFFPSSSASSFLRLDGKSYRGILDISLNKAGQITVVNQLRHGGISLWRSSRGNKSDDLSGTCGARGSGDSCAHIRLEEHGEVQC